MEILISIGERLKNERDRFGMSQSDLAAIAEKKGVPGTTRHSQANYEKGKQSPSAAYLAALAESGFDVQYIVTGIRAGEVTEVKGEYMVVRKDQKALLDNLEHCPKGVQDAIKRLAFEAQTPQENDETQKSA